jgi:hypothetical protein
MAQLCVESLEGLRVRQPLSVEPYGEFIEPDERMGFPQPDRPNADKKGWVKF